MVSTYAIDAIDRKRNGQQGTEFITGIRIRSQGTGICGEENGASVYSASKIAREEFPEYDVTVRGAVVGRRLMDPLAELVKIDPKALVGQ